MTFWQKNGWWLSLVFIVVLACGVKLAERPPAVEVSAAMAPILIIDAGHGGADGGAVAASGTLECDVNLDIALRLEALCAFWGTETVMTRSGPDIEYPPEATTISSMKRADQHGRVALVNNTPGGVLLSIHQNFYPATAPNGPQVFFGKHDGSNDLASIIQYNLTSALCPDNRRVASAVDEDVYLLKMAQRTAVLVECGFLSNPEELEKLESEEYRLKLASVFLASWLQYTRGVTQ